MTHIKIFLDKFERNKDIFKAGLAILLMQTAHRFGLLSVLAKVFQDLFIDSTREGFKRLARILQPIRTINRSSRFDLAPVVDVLEISLKGYKGPNEGRDDDQEQEVVLLASQKVPRHFLL